MELVYLFIGIAIGTVIAAIAAFAYWKPRHSSLSFKLAAAESNSEANRIDDERLRETFNSLASDALKSNSESFLTLAKENLGRHQQQAKTELDKHRESFERLVKPVEETLKRVDTQLGELEKARLENYTALKTEVKNLSSQTATLAGALRRPSVRGRWGEMQLRRVVEIAGMTSYCDFQEQVTVGDPDETRLRPDMIINLAGGKQIVVDAKVPLESYMTAMEAETDEARDAGLRDHLRQTRAHVVNLSSKSYWEQFESTPELAVMFIPADSTFMAALDQDPNLIEWAAQRQVFLASPITLIALLKAVAVGWREEQLAENARAISSLGQDLYQRISVFVGHFSRIGSRLNSAVGAFNEAAGSLDSRVLPKARQFQDLGVITTDEQLTANSVDRVARELRAPESSALPKDDDKQVDQE